MQEILNAFKKFGKTVTELRFHRFILDINILQIIMDNYLPKLSIFNFGFESMFHPGNESEHREDDSLIIKYNPLVNAFIDKWIKMRDNPLIFQFLNVEVLHFLPWIEILEAMMHFSTSFQWCWWNGCCLTGEIQNYLADNYEIDQDNLVIKCADPSYWQNLLELCYDSQLEHIKFALAIVQNAPNLRRLHLRFPARLIPTEQDQGYYTRYSRLQFLKWIISNIVLIVLEYYRMFCMDLKIIRILNQDWLIYILCNTKEQRHSIIGSMMIIFQENGIQFNKLIQILNNNNIVGEFSVDMKMI